MIMVFEIGYFVFMIVYVGDCVGVIECLVSVFFVDE